MKIIGRRERLDFPEWELASIEAKIDTGAYGCAMHCHHIEVIEQNGTEFLRFQLFDPNHPEYEDKYYFSSDFRDKKVKSSTGELQHRYALKTKVLFFGKKYTVEFSLTDRSEMKYPVLLGRKFLKRKFLVDVSQKDISYILKSKVK